ncbi:hypothetical protein [Streptomyces bullii]|uniref:Uncharacterized protein n=1 Tax=Streptomyces bullii TaxID=349910 RepID=A0ABW0UWM0_9ACTN
MRSARRFRRLVVGEAVWYWTVRQRVRPVYADCRLKISFVAEGTGSPGRRLTLVFAPSADGVVSNTYVESGTVTRLPDRSHLNLHEPGTARRLLDAAAPTLERWPSKRHVEVDGWPCFARVVGGPGGGASGR